MAPLNTRVILSGLWVALMLVYLLGDVLRIFSGDYKSREMGQQLTQFIQSMWLGIAILMVIPIVMIVLSLLLPQPVNRWTNIIAAGFFILFNLVGLPTYPSLYDKFLLLISMVFNGVTIWYAWHWA
jgi:hypothetical protein